MTKLYNITINKRVANPELFKYPCQAINLSMLKGRRIYVHNRKSALYVDFIRIFEGSVEFADTIENATDIIVLPSIVEDTDTPETYKSEMLYYYDALNRVLDKKLSYLKNVIVLLPPNSTIPSTNYKRMADYSAAKYIDGLSKHSIHLNRRCYGIEISDNFIPCESLDLLLYCMSTNSNHLICDIFKIDR